MRAAFEGDRGRKEKPKRGKTDCFLFLRTNAHWLLDMCLEQRLRPWKYTFNRKHYHSISLTPYLVSPVAAAFGFPWENGKPVENVIV